MSVLTDINALDNGGENTVAEVRTALMSVLHDNWAPYSVGDADDVWWEGDSGDFTDVDPSGSPGWAEYDGYLSAEYSGQSAAHLSVSLKPFSFTIGDEWVTKIRHVGRQADFSFSGFVFTNGTTTTSKVGGAFPYLATSHSYLSSWRGVLNNLATNVLLEDAGAWVIVDGIYVKLTYSATDKIQVRYSADGKSFTTLGGADLDWSAAGGFTPTHFGPAVSKWGSAGVSSASFSPFCKVA